MLSLLKVTEVRGGSYDYSVLIVVAHLVQKSYQQTARDSSTSSPLEAMMKV